ncbi:hypothetical protein [Mesoterricola sediminis]|uniref:Uncharacterized protein n=1 Tax=Mesoterricola sediminis TaxID=2927980 RepID=A0AA48KF35_9BACT|nr:hypothetical protein [Mesoterricola sediminis]BDU77917.1 hypothetical protein METESE_28750 [Mesoterricola sediminis]
MLPLALAAAWCGLLLGAQVVAARRLGRRPLYAPASGRAGAGVFYAFTGALMPWAKESVRGHLVTYAAGILYHAGIAASFARLAVPARALSVVALAGALAGLGLLVKRASVADLRGLSRADDFLSNGLATAFAALAGLAWLPWAAAALPWACVALLVYLPLGKLRHAVFFFLSRRHLGAFFGRRGVWPTAPQE